METMEQDLLITKASQIPEFKLGNFSLKAEFDEDDSDFNERARNELRETPEVVEQALKDIRVLIEGEPDFFVSDDEQFLRRFLRPCKWYPKSAFQMMKRFYTFKLNNPRYCANLLPSNEKNTFLAELLIPLPDRTENGCRILLINAGRKWNPKEITLDQIFRAAILSLDAAISESKTQISGVHVIMDLDGFSLNHVTQFTPSFAAALTDWVQRCLPCRLKGIHIVNQPFIFNMVYAIFKPFLLEKTRKRIHFHGTNRNSLISHIGTKPLPKELGGELIMPKEPIGKGIYEYFYCFEKEFEASSRYGYVKSAK